MKGKSHSPRAVGLEGSRHGKLRPPELIDRDHLALTWSKATWAERTAWPVVDVDGLVYGGGRGPDSWPQCRVAGRDACFALTPPITCFLFLTYVGDVNGRALLTVLGTHLRW